MAEARIAFLVPSRFDYIKVKWAIWLAGGVAVPLCLSAAEPELEYTLSDSQADCLVVSQELVGKVEPLCERLNLRRLVIEDNDPVQDKSLPAVDPNRRAMILYTSGTTSKPKGVVTTHRNIQSQIEMLVEAWEWDSKDSVPLFLPLHHIHGGRVYLNWAI